MKVIKKEKGLKKAYRVRVDEDEGYELIVFAESRNKAKMIAMNDLSCSGFVQYIDLHPLRFPNADRFVKENPNIEMLNFNNLEHSRFLRKEGWWSDSFEPCEECGFSEWEIIPESTLNAEGICRECSLSLAAAKTKGDQKT